MHVIDLYGEEYAIQCTSTWQGELNGNQTLSATIKPSKVNLLFIHEIEQMWSIVDDDDVEYKITHCKRKGEGNLLTVEIKALPRFHDDFNTQRIYEEYNQSMTAQYCFNLIFEGSGYNVDLVDSFNAITWQGFGAGNTRLGMFKDALNRYGAEFRIEGNTVYLEKQIGRDTQFMYRYKLNASNIVQENDASSFYTYAKGYGDYGDGEGGEDWQDANLIREYTSPLANIIGVREAPPIKNGNITTTETMDEQLKILVDESLKISVSADIHDLRKQGYALAQPMRGDRVFLIDERIGLNAEVRIVKMSVTKDFKGNIKALNLTLGSQELAERYQANLNSAAKNITQLLEGRIKLPFSALDNAVAQATKALQNMQSELTIPPNGGLMAVDTNDPNNVVLFNAAGIGVSDDGGATFKNSITGLGVVAERIYGQSIIGVNLSSVDETGYFHVNGSDAEFYDNTTNRRVAISPNGLFGYNSDGSERYRMDSLLVTSAALGTSNSNVYLAPDASNEARIVDVNGIPSDGAPENYSYRPLRALGYRFAPDANGYIGTDKEVRITSLGFTQDDGSIVYRDLRAASVYGNTFDLNTQSGVSDNIYVRPASGGEVRFTAINTNDNYQSVRLNGVYGNFIDKGTDTGVNLYARPAGGGALKVTVRGTTDTFLPVEALEFNANSSVYNKKNIEDYTGNATSLINDTSVRLFHMNEDVDEIDPKRLGLIVQESPVEIVNINGGKSVNLYAMASLLWKSVQELHQELEALKNGAKS